MAYYDLQNFTNATNLQEIVLASNQIVNDWWGLGLVFGFFVVSFLAMKSFPSRSSLPTSIYLTTIVSILCRISGLINNDMVPLLFIVASAVTLIILIFTK